jgi:hypothetical protein
MSLTLPTLVTSVNQELDNFNMQGSATATGDGATTSYLIAPLGRFIANDATLLVYVGGVATTSFTMNYDTGVLTFTAAPALAAVITFSFTHSPFNDSVIDQAITIAIDSLFPAFYVEKTNVTYTSASFVDGELAIPDCEAVIGYMTNSGTAWSRVPRKNYEMHKSGSSPTLRFFSGAPTATEHRLHYVARAALADLPDRAAAPIISYACYYMLMQKTAARTRGDIAIVTQGTGTLSPRQMNDAANAFYLRYQMQLATMKMRPWSTV